MIIEDVGRRRAVQPTIDRTLLYHLLSSGLKERWTWQFRENPAKAQITLLCLGLRPVGKVALVVTGGPVGNGADGRFRRLEVSLCIMWPAVAVTVSLLSLPLSGSDPRRRSYLRVRPGFSPFPSRNRSLCREMGHGGHVKGDSVAFWFSSFQPKFMYRSHVFSIVFKPFVGFDFKACYIHNTISWVSADLINLEDVYPWLAAKSNRPSHWKATVYLCFQCLLSERFFRAGEKQNVEPKWKCNHLFCSRMPACVPGFAQWCITVEGCGTFPPENCAFPALLNKTLCRQAPVSVPQRAEKEPEEGRG